MKLKVCFRKIVIDYLFVFHMIQNTKYLFKKMKQKQEKKRKQFLKVKKKKKEHIIFSLNKLLTFNLLQLVGFFLTGFLFPSIKGEEVLRKKKSCMPFIYFFFFLLHCYLSTHSHLELWNARKENFNLCYRVDYCTKLVFNIKRIY